MGTTQEAYRKVNASMFETLQSLRRSWTIYSGPIVAITMGFVGSLVLLTIDRMPDRKLHIACDRVVERLLTTHDPVELERSRILVHELDCGVSHRVNDWPPGRTGGLVP